jgi:hypothetical protein
MEQYADFPKMLYNAAGQDEIANSPGEEARLEALGFQSPGKGDPAAFSRAVLGGIPDGYQPQQYPAVIRNQEGDEVTVSSAADERRVRLSWGEAVPDEPPSPADEFAEFRAWKAARVGQTAAPKRAARSAAPQ